MAASKSASAKEGSKLFPSDWKVFPFGNAPRLFPPSESCPSAATSAASKTLMGRSSSPFGGTTLGVVFSTFLGFFLAPWPRAARAASRQVAIGSFVSPRPTSLVESFPAPKLGPSLSTRNSIR